jgi:hypothetical protein
MPSVSKKQHNFMEAIAHNSGFAKKVGVPQSVGQDFSKADKGKSFKRGGDMATKGVNPFAKFEKSGKDVEVKGKGKEGSKKEEAFDKKQMMGMKRGGGVKKMAGGGMTSMGKVKTAAPSKDGVAEKGKTKGTQIKMAGSGVPNGIGSRVMKKGGMAKC